MNGVGVCGLGAVSPAGWGRLSLREALARSTSLPATSLEAPENLRGLRVPPPAPRPPAFAHPRLRRASPIAQFAVAAALEALDQSNRSSGRLGVVFCTTCGPLHYTRRFLTEAVADPSTASPVLFPETVFNAAASHLASFLGAEAPSTTLIGDSGVVLEGIALAARWLLDRTFDTCLVIAAEELDWSVAAGWQPFSRSVLPSEGAAALCLVLPSAPHPLATLERVTAPLLYSPGISREIAASRVRDQLGPSTPGELLCDSLLGIPVLDRPEHSAWTNWTGPRLSPKLVLGEALAAGAGWQCVAAIDALSTSPAPAARISIVGLNTQAIGARFLHP